MVENRDLVSYRFKTEKGKTFFFDIKRNENGRFLKITESRPRMGQENSYIRNFMTVPEDSLDEFMENLNNTISFLNENQDAVVSQDATEIEIEIEEFDE
jgi:hypothetical protein